MKYSFAFIFLFIAFSAIGQHIDSNSTIEKEYTFKQDTKDDQITIAVDKNCVNISFSFLSQIDTGYLLIEIIDPNGKKEGGFELESVDSDKEGNHYTTNNSGNHSYVMQSSGSTMGSVNKNFQNPIPGKWKLTIKVKKVTGDLRLKMYQQLKNRQ